MAYEATREAPGDGPFEHFMHRIDRVVWHLERAMAFISSLFIFGLMLIGVTQIFSRKLLNAPIFGYIDLVELSMATFVFLAISYTERLGGHVRMELVVGQLKGRTLWVAEFIGTAVALFVIGVLIYYGYTHALRAYVNGDSTIDAEYALWPSKAMVPFAFSILWLRLLVQLYGFGRLIAKPQAEPIAIPEKESVESHAEKEAQMSASGDAEHLAPGAGERRQGDV